jgi:predicted permease
MIYSRYFETMGIAVVAGRDFTPSDLVEHAPMAALVNEAFARRYFGGANPVGRHFFTRPPREYFTASSTDPFLPCTILGMVKDSRYASLRGKTPPTIYQPFFQANTGRGQMVLHVRTAVSAATLVPLIRKQVQAVDPALPAFDFRTLSAEMDAALVEERLLAALSGLFGALALLLACVGLYGLLVFASVQRTGEIGIRMALGARRGDVLRMILRDALLLVGAGIAIGVPAAIAAAHIASSRISGLVFGLSATDPATFAAAALVLLGAGVIAAVIPARRASRVDPATALRAE